MFEYRKRVQSVLPRQSAATGLSTRLVLCGLLALGGAFFLPVHSLSAQTPTPVTVPTWRYDLTHAGQNTSETALTPANVSESSFGKLFSLPVDSTVYAQPLYVPGLTMSDGLVHNVLFVATEHDSIYAFDADSNGGVNLNPIWHISLSSTAHGAAAGATTVPWQDAGSPDVAPEVGITGTPAINPATNTMYVVAATKENGVYYSRLHAINILNGAERANSPVVIQATVAGTGTGSSNGQLSFSPLWQNQRGALDYYNGYVYFGYGAHGDDGPWHGWLFAYNATTLAQTAVLCTSPNGYGAGVWEAGAGLPIDDTGQMFLTTGNGTYSTYPPFNGSSEFGESIVNFNIANGGLTPTDAFTPFNGSHLNGGDLDQGSGGILMVPDQQGANPHILVQAGKEGRILVLNRDHLGGYAAGASYNTNILQDIPNQINGLWSTPAYWNGNVYIWGDGDVPKLFQLNSGVMDTTPSSKSTITSAFPGASFSVSSNGAQDGIAWAVRSDLFNTHGAAVLYAWPATDLSTPLYESDTNSTRDAAGAANKFSTPVVTNGKVYVAANGQVDVYGLFNGEPTAAAPVITPDGGTFGDNQSVTLSSATSSANIFYTLNGSAPTPGSTLYTEPITIGADTTLRAIASASGYVQSGVSSATFTFSDQTPPVSFLPAAGTYTAAQQVTLSDTDTGAKIYYTTNGSTPTASSALYSGPITVSASQTINAIAIDPSLQNSNLATAAYLIQAGGSSINFGSGFSSTAGLDLNGDAVATDDTRLQLTNGLPDESSSVFWNQPIGIQSFTTTFEFQLSLAQGDGFTFTVQGVGPKALGGGYAGLGYSGIGKSVAVKFDFYNNAGEGNDSTGVFTGGALPTVPAVNLAPSGIELNSGDGIQATITYDGTTLTVNLLDLVTKKTFTFTRVINIPQIVGGNTAYVGFTGSSGGLTSSQKILTWTYATQTVSPAPAINFASGFSSTAGLSLVGAASVGAGVLQVTLAPTTQSKGAAWFSTPVNVSAFTTDFNFQLLSPKADGFTFTIQNQGASAIGPAGSGLGYGGSKPGASGGIQKSVAVKFDIYSNLGEGTDSTGFYTDGASPTTPATDMTSSGVVLRSGHVLHAHITYDGTNLTLVLTDTTTSASFTKTAAINIPSIVGSPNAYVGFTGGTGGLSLTTQIDSWTLTSQ